MGFRTGPDGSHIVFCRLAIGTKVSGRGLGRQGLRVVCSVCRHLLGSMVVRLGPRVGVRVRVGVIEFVDSWLVSWLVGGWFFVWSSPSSTRQRTNNQLTN